MLRIKAHALSDDSVHVVQVRLSCVSDEKLGTDRVCSISSHRHNTSPIMLRANANSAQHNSERRRSKGKLQEVPALYRQLWMKLILQVRVKHTLSSLSCARWVAALHDEALDVPAGASVRANNHKLVLRAQVRARTCEIWSHRTLLMQLMQENSEIMQRTVSTAPRFLIKRTATRWTAAMSKQAHLSAYLASARNQRACQLNLNIS